MKRKPMLLKALNQNSVECNNKSYADIPNASQIGNLQGNIIIAVAGASRGVGCTHTAIAIANYIAHKGYSVALVEMNNNKHFVHIYDTNYQAGLLDNSFSIDNVDYYMQSEDGLLKILNAGYQYIVLDLSIIKTTDTKGRYINNPNFIEMQRASKQILVCGIKDWQLQDLSVALGGNESLNWNLYVTFADDDMFNMFKKEVKRNVFLAPFCPDCAKFYDEQNRVISMMIGDVVSVKRERKKGY